MGEFAVRGWLTGAAPIIEVGEAIPHSDFVGKYALDPARMLNLHEQALVPKLEPWYILPQEVVSICKHASLSTGKSLPMRNFLLRGPAGTGKTEGAKAIAAGLGLPYVKYTCSANTEVYDFIGQVFPDTDGASTGDAELDREREMLKDMGGITYGNVKKLMGLPDLDDMDYDPKVVLQNNTDFIVKRQTAKTERELVILISKGLYYIKDCKTGGIDPVTEANLRAFLRELKVETVALEQVHWMPHLFYESADAIFRVVSDEVLTDMCRHNVMDNMPDPYWFKPYWVQNSKLFMRLHSLFPSLTEQQKYMPCIPVIYWLEQTYGTNEATYFAEQLARSGIRSFSTSYSSAADFTRSAELLVQLYLQEVNRCGLDNVALLTPFRKKTETGVQALNERLRALINPPSADKSEIVVGQRALRLGDKVMQIQNQDEVSNGDVG